MSPHTKGTSIKKKSSVAAEHPKKTDSHRISKDHIVKIPYSKNGKRCYITDYSNKASRGAESICVFSRSIFCPFCDISYRQLNSVITHIGRDHRDESSLPAEFPQNRMEAMSVASMPPHRGKKCPKCPRRFTAVTGLYEHIRDDHKLFSDEIACDVCSKTFFTATNLREHQRNTHSEGLKCDHDGCTRTFANRFTLSRHRESIHERKKHLCPHCRKTFSQDSSLKLHVKRLHPGEGELPSKAKVTAHSCEHCEQRFSNMKDLIAHLRNIHQERYHDWVCGVEGCDFRATSKYRLQRHIARIHDNVQLKCEWCDKTFWSLKPWEAHIKKHGRGKEDVCQQATIPCPVQGCDKVYRSQTAVKTHYKNKHQGEESSDHLICLAEGCNATIKVSPGGKEWIEHCEWHMSNSPQCASEIRVNKEEE